MEKESQHVQPNKFDEDEKERERLQVLISVFLPFRDSLIIILQSYL